MCEICCEFLLSSNQINCISSQNSEQELHPCQFLSFQLSEVGVTVFISSGLWLQHPDPNPMNYKMCADMQQRVILRRVHNVNKPIWLWQDIVLRIINNATDEWCKCPSVRSCQKGTFWVQNLTANYIHLHFDVSVCGKLHVSRCYCVEYIKISLFLLFDIARCTVAL